MLKSTGPYYKSRADYMYQLFFNVSFKENQNSVLQLKFDTTYQVVKYYLSGRMMIIEKTVYIILCMCFIGEKKRRLGKLEGITFDEHFSLFVQVYMYIHDSYCVGTLNAYL